MAQSKLSVTDMKTDTGGPAFPEAFQTGDRGEYYVEYTPGATLLDHFAGQVLAGIVDSSGDDNRTLAGVCYKMAEAMISEKRRLEQ